MATEFWYRISNQFEISQHDNPELSMKDSTKYWIEVVNNNRKHITSISKNEFELYDYRVYDNTVEPSQIKQQKLTCVKIYDNMANSWGTRIVFEIEDDEHLIRKCFFGSVYLETGKDAEEAILDGISFMKKFGAYKSWELIDTKKENQKLIEENQKLRQKIMELESQIKESCSP